MICSLIKKAFGSDIMVEAVSREAIACKNKKKINSRIINKVKE